MTATVNRPVSPKNCIRTLCRGAKKRIKPATDKGKPRIFANLIVMGSHGRNALTAAILGSVAYGVIHNETKVPVLIVRRGL